MSLCILLPIWAALLAVAFGQANAPTNNTAMFAGTPKFLLSTTLSSMNVQFAIQPLTSAAGLSGTTSQLQQLTPSGPLSLLSEAALANFTAGGIGFISCEDDDYLSGRLHAAAIISNAALVKPAAIVLYSERAAACSFEAAQPPSFQMVYTMLDAKSSRAVVDGLREQNSVSANAAIRLDQSSVINSTANGTTSSTTGSTSSSGTSSSTGSRPPTTAVAMIILYSITGIITAMFVIIIVVGAMRAHRHPERYGPRRIVGRPRQSRAKGIARAMLDTLPIVKFGHEDDIKPVEPVPQQDVELGRTVSQSADSTRDEKKENATIDPMESSLQGTPVIEMKEKGKSVEMSKEPTAVSNPDTDTIETVPADQASATTSNGKSAAQYNPVDEGLACSVCTDDFVKGQNIRLLPCRHKFHPECIDPWLLNVSGTCPLCRIELQPKTTDEDEQPNAADGEADDDAGPSLYVRGEIPSGRNTLVGTVASTSDEPATNRRRSRILSGLNVNRMRHATPQERLEILRSLRNLSFQQADESGERRPSHPRLRRLSRAMGGQAGLGDGASEATSSRRSSFFTNPLGLGHSPEATRRGSRAISTAQVVDAPAPSVSTHDQATAQAPPTITSTTAPAPSIAPVPAGETAAEPTISQVHSPGPSTSNDGNGPKTEPSRTS